MKEAKIIRFYRLSYSELAQLPVPTVGELWEAIDVLEAQEQILACETALYPMLKQSARDRKNRELYRKAYPSSLYPPKTVSAKDLAKKLNGR